MSPTAKQLEIDNEDPKPDVLKAYPRTQQDVDLIDRAVKSQYQSRSGFILKAAIDRAKEVLEHDTK